INEVGVLASNPQFATLPLASVTSMKNHECGFSNLISVSTPFTSTGRSASNAAANAWCAHAGIGATSVPTLSAATANIFDMRRDMFTSLTVFILPRPSQDDKLYPSGRVGW